MKKYRLPAVILAVMVLAAGCGQNRTGNGAEEEDPVRTAESSDETGGGAAVNEETVTNAVLPEELSEIPQDYFSESEYQGTLVELEYDTYESMTYEEHSQVLHKRAIVYLPYGYSEEEPYNVFYLMHGGWSNETTYLGTPEQPNEFKNVFDNGIADGKIRPMIVVCPTYNNTSTEDSADYSLALRLTENTWPLL